MVRVFLRRVGKTPVKLEQVAIYLSGKVTTPGQSVPPSYLKERIMEPLHYPLIYITVCCRLTGPCRSDRLSITNNVRMMCSRLTCRLKIDTGGCTSTVADTQVA